LFFFRFVGISSSTADNDGWHPSRRSVMNHSFNTTNKHNNQTMLQMKAGNL
jgi:hypothetical protein